MSAQQEIERGSDEAFQFFAGNDRVEESVLQQEFGALKSIGQRLADGLLDHARAGETDQRAGFADIQIAEHGEAGGDATGGGIGQHRDVRDFGVVQSRQRGRNFGELHQADGAVYHAGAARARDDEQRLTGVEANLHSAGHVLADPRAHGAADKIKFHRAADYRAPGELAFGGDDGVVHAELFAGFLQAHGVGLGVYEFQRVGRGHASVVLGPAAVEEHLQALLGVHFEMEAALGADQEIGFEILAEDDGAAGLALDPQTFGAHFALFGRSGLLDGFFVALEPSHS